MKSELELLKEVTLWVAIAVSILSVIIINVLMLMVMQTTIPAYINALFCVCLLIACVATPDLVEFIYKKAQKRKAPQVLEKATEETSQINSESRYELFWCLQETLRVVQEVIGVSGIKVKFTQHFSYYTPNIVLVFFKLPGGKTLYRIIGKWGTWEINDEAKNSAELPREKVFQELEKRLQLRAAKISIKEHPDAHFQCYKVKSVKSHLVPVLFLPDIWDEKAATTEKETFLARYQAECTNTNA